MKKIYLIALVVLGISADSFAQDGPGATATAIASAQIITPITITKTADMNFGDVAVNGTAGTIVLAPNSSRTTTGGATAATPATNVSAAAFTVTGVDGAIYAVTLPTTINLTSSGNTMVVNNFKSSLGLTGKGPISAGSTTLTVGATLNVSAGQPAGTYVSTAFDVTVDYN